MKRVKWKESLKEQKIPCFLKTSLTDLAGKPIDYRIYHCTREEILRYSLEGILIFGCLGWLFFQEIFATLIISTGAVFYVKKRERGRKKERKEQLAGEFCRGAEALLNALETGYSKENAVREAIKDLTDVYRKETLILPEFRYMQRQLSVNRPLEELFLDLGERSGIEDIKTFGEVFSAAGRKGGNLIQIIKKTVVIMKEKQALLEEIKVETAAKRLEFRIMCMIVPGMVVYLQVFSPGFLDILYHNLIGQLFMGILFFSYLGAIELGERMTEVEI